MADTLQLRAGRKRNMPTLADRELAYVRDEEALYVGTPEGNVKIGAKLEQAIEEMSTKAEAMELVMQGHDDTLSDIQEEMQTQGETLTKMQDDIDGKLTANAATAQANIATDAELPAVIASINNLIAALKDSGIMKT